MEGNLLHLRLVVEPNLEEFDLLTLSALFDLFVQFDLFAVQSDLFA